MNEAALKEIWRTANERLEESLVLNMKHADEISRLKLHHIVSSMKPLKIFALLVGILWVGSGIVLLGNMYVHAFAAANKFFLFSASVQVLLTAIALWMYLYQIIKIYQVNSYEPVMQTQEKLVQLRISTLWSARILCLQLPVWTTFWWNETMLTDWNLLQWITVLIVTFSFTYLAIWLFVHINYGNRNKKWFRLMFNGKEWTPLMRSMELLEELEAYRVKE